MIALGGWSWSWTSGVIPWGLFFKYLLLKKEDAMNDPETGADESSSDREADRTWDDIDSDPPSPI